MLRVLRTELNAPVSQYEEIMIWFASLVVFSFLQFLWTILLYFAIFCSLPAGFLKIRDYVFIIFRLILFFPG